jgi:3-phosphoshikimate 1-carboxyvinyltransferase
VLVPPGRARLVTTFVASPAAHGIRGVVRVPGDKSISHRALLLAALAEGRSRIVGLSNGDDVARTLRAITAFGASVDVGPDRAVIVDGGRGRLHEPDGPVDVGNSGTAIRLLAGWASTIDGMTVLTGDPSVARRPMDRVVDPLRRMGALIGGRQGGRLPPLVVRGAPLQGIDYRLPVPSAQVKGALLLAGLAARGSTTVRHDGVLRAHTEEMLAGCAADISVSEGAVTLRPGPLQPTDFLVPGDPSQAAFWVVAACITPGSDLTVEDVYVGPGRAGFLDVLRRMGADVSTAPSGSPPTVSIRARYGPLHATEVGGAEVPGLIDEIPILAVAAAYARGSTVFSDAAELKVKESDRVSVMVAALNAVGSKAEARPDGLVVSGDSGRPLAGGEVESEGDHRVAMSLSVAGLAAAAPVAVAGWESVATSYPSFEQDWATCVS